MSETFLEPQEEQDEIAKEWDEEEEVEPIEVDEEDEGLDL